MLAKDQQIGWSLFSFNLGLEAGQIVIVFCILLASGLIVNRSINLGNKIMITLKRKWWVWSLSALAFYIALNMMIDRWIF